MIDILESEISDCEKLFWHSIYDILTKRINGVIQLFYCYFNDSIELIITIERFNYSIGMTFPRRKVFEQSKLLNQILDCVRYNIYEVVFK